MKSIIFLVSILIAACTAGAQGEDFGLPYVHQEPAYDIAPSFPGGAEALRQYWADSTRYPVDQPRKKGSVMLRFTVGADGTPRDVVAINGVPGAPHYVSEAIRLVMEGPKWVPATKEGEPVEAEYTMSIPF